MTALDPITITALSKAVDFLFDQATKLMEERRESRKKRGDVNEQEELEHAKQLTPKTEVASWQPKSVYLKDIPREVKHCIEMIEQYRKNKRFTEESVSHYGGFKLSPISIRNELIKQEEEIKKWCQKLKDIIEHAYGHKISIIGLD